MTPQEFFDSFVDGNLIDCKENPDCIRRAFNAAVAASHIADHYFEYHRRHNPTTVSLFPTLGRFVEHVSIQTGGAFRDIRSMANAYKHLYTDVDPRKAARSSISSCGAIEMIEFDASRTEADLDRVDVCETGRVIFTRKDGTPVEFLPVLETVLEFWRRLL